MVAQNTKAGFLAFAGMIALMSPCSAALTTPPCVSEAYAKSLADNNKAGVRDSYTGQMVTAIINYFSSSN